MNHDGLSSLIQAFYTLNLMGLCRLFFTVKCVLNLKFQKNSNTNIYYKHLESSIDFLELFEIYKNNKDRDN